MEFKIALGAVVVSLVVVAYVQAWWDRRRKRYTFRPLHRMRIDAPQKGTNA